MRRECRERFAVSGIPGACTTHNRTYLVRGSCRHKNVIAHCSGLHTGKKTPSHENTNSRGDKMMVSISSKICFVLIRGLYSKLLGFSRRFSALYFSVCDKGELLSGLGCYKFFFGDNYNWERAKFSCEKHGLRLISIETQAENKALAGMNKLVVVLAQPSM